MTDSAHHFGTEPNDIERASNRASAEDIHENTLIINLPGSPKGVKESLELILDVLPHTVNIMGGNGH